MKKLKQLLKFSILAASLFASSAYAQQWCSGKVSHLWAWQDGGVYAINSSRGDHVQVCNINSVWKGVQPTTCAMWTGLIRSAVARKADMIFYYSEPTACNAIPTYGSAPAPGYVMLLN